MSRLARWAREQWGYGPLFALDGVVQLFLVRGEAQAATQRQRNGRGF